MKYRKLDELEMFDLIQAAYPEKFPGDDDETWAAVHDFVETIVGAEGVADLLGRVVMLSTPMKSGLTERWSHCLGPVVVTESGASMIAAVRRDVV